MKKLFLISVILISTLLSAQTIHQTNYSGILTIKDRSPLAFEMELTKKGGIVNGFSLTGKGTSDETESDISGIYNRNTKTYKLKETQVLSTKSEADLNTFCYIHMELTEKGKFKLKRYEGTFTGFFTNGDTCATGVIILMEKEKLEEITKIVEKKIEKQQKKVDKNEVLSTKLIKEGDDMYIQWNSDKLTVFIWDANTEDGDKIDLVINGKEILNDFSTTKKRKKIKYKLKDGENKIEIKAKNVGKNPPNTSRIELSDSKTKYPIITQLQAGKSAIITIVK